MLIPRRTVRTSQPSAADLTIDYKGHLSAGLIGGQRGRHPMSADTTQQTSLAVGIANMFSGAAGYAFCSTTKPSAGPWALISYGVLTSGGAESSIMIHMENPGSSTRDGSLHIDSSNRVCGYIYTGGARNVVGSAITVGKPVLLIVTCDGTNLHAYADATGSSTASFGYGYDGYTSADLVFGYGSGGDPSTGSAWKSLYSLKLSKFVGADEARRLAANPWQIFEDEEDYRFIPAAVGGGGVDLVVQRSVHGHAADALSFSMDVYLSTADSLHTHAADNIALSLDSHLTISDANHAHVADDITLDTTASTSLLVQDAHHAHVADGVILTTQWLLAVASALHAHAAENLSLGTTGATNLLIDDASSAHASDNVGLSLDSFLAILDGLHGHGADNIALGTTGEATLTIAEAIHAHTADSIGLTIAALLVIAEALHAHTADSLTLDTSNATFLTVQGAGHAHIADSVTLSLDTWLTIAQAAHGHTADSPTLSSETALQIAESLHAHYADVMVLSMPGATTLTADDITAVATAVLAALRTASPLVPVDAVSGAWPTATQNADELLARDWP